MSLLRPFKATDCFKFNSINLDSWTETYSTSYYLQYLSQWGELFSVQEHPDGTLMGYGSYCRATALTNAVMGKTEGQNQDWHGHVTAITVSPAHRRIGLAKGLMRLLEKMSEHQQAYFVDLYVRMSNDLAVSMYEGLGYSVYRRVVGYYSGGVKDGDEDAYDMRKALPRDKHKTSVRPNGRLHLVSPAECWP